MWASSSGRFREPRMSSPGTWFRALLFKISSIQEHRKLTDKQGISSIQTKGQNNQTKVLNISWSNYSAHSKGRQDRQLKLKYVRDKSLSIESWRCKITLKQTIQARFNSTEAGRKQNTKRKSIASSPIPKSHLVQSTLRTLGGAQDMYSWEHHPQQRSRSRREQSFEIKTNKKAMK